MDVAEIAGLLLVGFFAGMLGGLVGVGGGVLFVPGLVLFVGLGQLEAESTSLLAIVFVAAVGAWRQGRYGNLRVRDGIDAADGAATASDGSSGEAGSSGSSDGGNASGAGVVDGGELAVAVERSGQQRGDHSGVLVEVVEVGGAV